MIWGEIAAGLIVSALLFFTININMLIKIGRK